MGIFAKANAAHGKLPKEAARTSAHLAAIVLADAELRRALRFGDDARLSHYSVALAPLLKRKPHSRQELGGLFVGLGGRHDRDVHAARLVDLVVVDFGKYQLLP